MIASRRAIQAVAALSVAACLGLLLAASCDNAGGILGERPAFRGIGAGLTGLGDCSLAWGDYDSDGDLDLALAGRTRSGEVSKVYRNDGGTFTDIGAGLTGVSHGCSLAWGDYDGDGDLDLALAGSYVDGESHYFIPVSKAYRNDGGAFVDINAGLTGVDDCSLAWGDYDKDGDLDLALAGYAGGIGRVSKVYRNDGGTFTDIAAGLTGVSSCSLAWGDYDNDGSLDLALAGNVYSTTRVSKVYRNYGGTFAQTYAGLTGVDGCSLAWGDCDSDGDLDLAVAGSVDRHNDIYVATTYRNDGGTFTDIGAGLTGVASRSLVWGDYDNDGDLDLALAGSYSVPVVDGTGSIIISVSKVYRNDGRTFAAIVSGLENDDCFLAWGDHDSDGDLDLALAGYHWDGRTSVPISKVYRNDIAVPNTPPSAPTVPSASVSGGGPYEVAFSWDPAADAETPSPGLTYNLRVWTDDGSEVVEVMPGMADPVTGRRLIPAMGNVQHAGPVTAPKRTWTLHLPAGTYYWSVQAIDTAFAGGAWAPEQSVTAP